MYRLIKLISFFCILLSIYGEVSFAQDTAYIPVHFLYGSRPRANYKFIEPKWFGGKMGGHVGIQTDSNKILNFIHRGNFHLVSSNQNKHSKFIYTTTSQFNSIFGGDADKMKTLTIFIPVNSQQFQKLDSISKCYLDQPPYDYALFGMRCAASTYEVLAQLGIVPGYSHNKISRKIFYPKLLRKRLLQKAEENGWQIQRQAGSPRRIWEID